MPERKSEHIPETPWRVPVAVEDIAEDGKSFALEADAETRAAIAKMAGLRDLPQLAANFDVMRHSTGGLHVIGRVSATVGQSCVVTLEPLLNPIEEEIDLVFAPRAEQAAAALETDHERAPAEAKRDEPEVLVGGTVDLGALAIEFLILGLNPYPRKPGAVFEAAQEQAAGAGPFAALAGWTKGRDGG
ncbi:MAG TPA: YceD family protein [Bradyrhizobium sp.]|nr:YceD family protein [Bradyrhizobium sp.]